MAFRPLMEPRASETVIGFRPATDLFPVTPVRLLPGAVPVWAGVRAPLARSTCKAYPAQESRRLCWPNAPARRQREHGYPTSRSEEHTSELQSLRHLVCRL